MDDDITLGRGSIRPNAAYGVQQRQVAVITEQKLEVCRLVESGESFRKIAESFGVGLSTISDIYRSRRQLNDFVSLMDTLSSCSSRKSMKKAANSALDSAVYMWFLQKRALDQPISGPILQEKAADFSSKLGIDNVVASSGWLRNFKSRHGIRELKMHGEKLSADSESAAKFTATLNDFITKEGYDLDFVYNADETGLVWKCLPKTSLVSMTEKTASGFKSCKERVTVLCCVNATGSDRLPLLLVGKSKRP
ncbi:Jerky -like protein-like [Trichinella zimbabwensis]|uniref:Jerky-like protein-like n=1 Tax=Trichinella zimbabwensis TaxID=268475 RepID=A0A0V1GVA6_9BILA|nr:Jerky -like protein-like [Trichinella zimbabwensis]